MIAAENVNATETTGRDDKGRFAKGNLGGPGNPFARRCAKLRQLFHDAATDEKMQAIIEVVFVKAMSGDLAAAKMVFAYTIGRPAAAVDPETLDQQELNKFINGHLPASTDIYGQVVNGMPVELLLNLLRIAVPEFTRNKGQTALDIIKTPPEQADQDDEFDDDEFDEEDEETPVEPESQPEPEVRAEPEKRAGNVSDRSGADLPVRIQERMRGPSANGKKHEKPPIANGVNGKMSRKKRKLKKRAGDR